MLKVSSVIKTNFKMSNLMVTMTPRKKWKKRLQMISWWLAMIMVMNTAQKWRNNNKRRWKEKMGKEERRETRRKSSTPMTVVSPPLKTLQNCLSRASTRPQPTAKKRNI